MHSFQDILSNKKPSIFKKTLLLTCVVISTLILTSCQPTPNSLTIISLVPPKDFDVVLIINDDDETKSYKTSRAWEVYNRFSFLHYAKIEIENAVLRITAHGETFEINIDTEIVDGLLKTWNYHSVVMLNIQRKSIIYGISLSRSIFLISLRVCLFIAIMGILFYLFGYLKRRSWIAFTAISLPGEIFINFAINSVGVHPDRIRDVLIIVLCFGLPLLILKLVAMCIAINEHSRWKTILYVITVNFISLVLYPLWIFHLP